MNIIQKSTRDILLETFPHLISSISNFDTADERAVKVIFTRKITHHEKNAIIGSIRHLLSYYYTIHQYEGENPHVDLGAWCMIIDPATPPIERRLFA